MKVRITKPARADIRRTFDYLAVRAGRHKAREITAEIRERCDGLERMPQRYAELPGFAGLRRRIYRDYLIVYRIRGRTIDVVRVLHGASDCLGLLSDQQE